MVDMSRIDSSALDQLSNADTRALLNTIDSLRELLVGKIVDLIQIIVVGDQPSGKSSVLEAISVYTVRYPVGSSKSKRDKYCGQDPICRWGKLCRSWT